MDHHQLEPVLVSSPGAARDAILRLPATTNPPGPQNPPQQLVWLIFGATGHMGRSLVKSALVHNDLVAAVGRTFENSAASMERLQRENKNSLGLLCDVRVRETVQAAIDRTINHFGRIDIIANCSGYGVIGACEDQEEYDIRNQFETNFMGTLNIVQCSLPHFRQRTAGRYLIFSSTSGALGVPGLGPYCASKYAVEGLIESMLYEIDCFNIKGTLVEPGHIRRDDFDSLPGIPVPENYLSSPLPAFGHFLVKPAGPAYNGQNAPAAHAKRVIQWLGDKQPTSAVKAAELVWQLGHCSYPPLRLLLGSYAVESIRDRLKCITEEIEDWKHLSFPPSELHPMDPSQNRGENADSSTSVAESHTLTSDVGMGG
ncbi:1,2-dihydroxy-3-keto-5-methylthiopentene dioxygenase [Ophidiomyces ophidiicola]|nr:1,2-dihydroxy-3-keto-5-methylthiopentene dioxygenase [Ophidiomyces ophidiicola]KAI1933283.1 1,2-dihydroxy-3-keto-5-methylthiopentene dioxygenase [Ophidiomyces ophidiicola]KAI1955958.1 1,2-dihydroxy-3-keto-5-methylthiopentene dioxygenase [Ophidiomyces ophidiicola]